MPKGQAFMEGGPQYAPGWHLLEIPKMEYQDEYLAIFKVLLYDITSSRQGRWNKLCDLCNLQASQQISSLHYLE
jgi:hypothetical protein